MLAAALGAVYTLAGRVTDAVPLLTQAAAVMEREDLSLKAFYSLPLGQAYLLAGRLEEANALAERTLVITRARRERGHRAYALRLPGEIAAHRTPPDVAAAAVQYCQALALAEELGMRPLQAHCHHGLGTLYATVGQREQARAALTTAIELYRAMDMTFWLPQAEAALVRVG